MNQQDDEAVTTRKRIIDATIQLMYEGEQGELTTRQIAQKAGVNAAAINYHFQGKDRLIDEAVRTAAASAFEMGKNIITAPGEPPLERLRRYLQGYAQGLMKFPGLTRTAWLNMFRREETTYYARFMKEMVELVAGAVGEARGAGNGVDSEPRALMLISAVILPFLVSGAIEGAGGVDYADDEARTRYIETAIRLLADAKEK
jgi:TetR/AcrR family transcriptional regulator, regulator of cefoperazone and chloramphenicol sensitivity